MLRIRLVGDLGLELDGQALQPPASGRARSLLAWLAYHPGLHTRARVASVFWPDVLDSSARGSLRTTLALLRRDLGDAASEALVAGRDRLGIEDACVDLRESRRLIAEGRHDEALALADGDLLTDLDDDWVLEEREVHRGGLIELLTAVGDAAEQAGDLEAAAAHARRRLELDPLSESAARVLIRRLGEVGDAAAAVAEYEAFRARLRGELGMTPTAETRELVERLRSSGPAPPARPLPGALARDDRVRLVGRGEQLTALRSAWRRASAGAATVVTVAGEAGSGKTRLLTELAREAHDAGATVFAGRCVEGGLVAFAPFTEALRQYAADVPDALPDWTTAELARLLPELGPEASAPTGDPQDARHRLFEAVAAVVGTAARRDPVLLVVEDLHWADPATLGMLAHVIRTVEWAPLLVAGSLRDERRDPALHALLDDLRRDQRLRHLLVGGLSHDEVRDLVGAWLGEQPPPALVEVVHERTGGNPLFVEELVRHLDETHAGSPPEDLIEPAQREVPHGVRSVIDRRLARLPEPARAAVTAAAVLGEDFELTHVAAICEQRDAAAAEALEVAVEAGLVDESQRAGRYRFAHALVRGALVAGLTGTRRALLHRRVAEMLEARADETRLGEVALHLLDARPLVDAETAARAALRAADQATASLAYEDAVELLRRAVAGDLDGLDPLRAQLLVALGEASLRSGDAVSAQRCFTQAAELARALSDPRLLAAAALGAAGLTVNVGPVREQVRSLLEEALAGIDSASELRPRLLARLAIESYYVPPVALRERLSDEALSNGRRAGGSALLEALGARHVALWSPAHAEERLTIADELIDTARLADDAEAELQGVNWRVTDLVELGRLDEARAAIDEHERLAGDLRLLGYAWYVPMWRAMLALLGGRVDEAQRLSEEGERIGAAAHDANAELLFGVQRRAIRNATGRLTAADRAEIDDMGVSSPAAAAWRTWAAGIALAHGETERARAAVRREVEGMAALPLDANWLYTAAALGVRVAHLGDAAAAAVVYPQLLPYRELLVTSGRATSCCGSVELSLGLVASTLGERDAAAEHLERAALRNDALGAVPLAAAARDALAGGVPDGLLRWH